MEVHPVPKNILTVEFKLFAGLSVRQFVIIVAACGLGVFIFLTPFPKLITIPISLFVVGFGVISALSSGFATRAITFLRAIFVSPRYVWKKSTKENELLKQAKEQQAKTELTVKNQKSQEINVSLDRLLELRNNTKQASSATNIAPQDNFSRLYNQEFSPAQNRANPTPQNPTTLAEAASLPAGLTLQPGKVLPMQMVNNSAPRARTTANSDNPVNNISLQIESLKQELAGIAKLPVAEQEVRKQEVMEKINQIYNQVNTAKPISAQEQLKVLKQAETRPLFGVVVNSKNQALHLALVNVLDDHTLVVGQTKTREDGKFALEIPDVAGNYFVEIIAPGFKFPVYKISLANGKLPAYKFRSE